MPEANKPEARSMVSFAELDYLSSRVLFDHSLTLTAVVFGFYAIEKWLKAFLIENGAETEESLKKKYGHNLDKVISECSKIKKEFQDKELLDSIEKFKVGGKSRYRDDLLEFTMGSGHPNIPATVKDIDFIIYKLIEITSLRSSLFRDGLRGINDLREVLIKNNKYFS